MGNINVFTGPMNCGKSQNLIQEANKQKIAGKEVAVFKPLIDDRFSTDNIMDRNGNKFPAVNIEKIDEIEKYDADVYIIDEFQFLPGDIEVILKLADKGKRFFIGGLNLTAERKPFGLMGDILCYADNIHLMTAICDECHSENAIYTYCKVEKTGEILVGDDEYSALCSECYQKLIAKKK